MDAVVLVKSLYAIPTSPRTAALIAEHRALADELAPARRGKTRGDDHRSSLPDPAALEQTLEGSLELAAGEDPNEP
jgi:hypothetical protein